MPRKFVPSGFTGTWTEKYIHEVIEKYLYDSWTENNIPKRSEISFGYALGQNVSDSRKSVALKCLDGGQEVIDKGTNYASAMYVNKVVVHLEGRLSTGNFQKDSPVSLEQTKLQIMNIINGDPMALINTEGIFRMVASSSDPVYPLKDRVNFFGLDVNITVTRFMTRVEVSETMMMDFTPQNFKSENYKMEGLDTPP